MCSEDINMEICFEKCDRIIVQKGRMKTIEYLQFDKGKSTMLRWKGGINSWG